MAIKYDNRAEQRVRKWHVLIDENRDKPLVDQMYEVNRFFNRIQFSDDITVFKQHDYWATPIKFLGENAGDCEDFTVAKYVSLIALSVPDDHLQLMYVTAIRSRQAHMVLAYYAKPDAIPLLLDNLNKRILPAFRRGDLIPIYSVNGKGLCLAKEQGRGRRLQSENNNKLWTDLQKRMLEER